MPKKRKRKRRSALIPKEWKVTDGVATLPEPVRMQVRSVLDKMSIEEPQIDGFFSNKFSISQRQTLAYELNMAGVTYRDIATLMSCSISGAFMILQRAFAEAAQHLPQNWLPNNFVDDYYAMKDAAQRNRAWALSAVDSEERAAFSRNEITARGKSMDALLKGVEITKQIKAATGEGAEPDPSERESTMQWVYEQKIAPMLEAPKEEPVEAQVVNESDAEV